MADLQGNTVGIVDLDVVARQSQKGRVFYQEYQQWAEEKRAVIAQMLETFQSKQRDFQTGMSDYEQNEAALELETLEVMIKRAQEDTSRESDLKLNSGSEQFRKELTPVVQQVAIGKGLDIVWDHAPNTNLVYFSDSVNISDDVIKAYDEMQ